MFDTSFFSFFALGNSCFVKKKIYLIVSLCSRLFSFLSDNLESDLYRKVKDKRPSAASAAGQILPAISDKSSHVTQVQGSRQDQLGWYFFLGGGGGIKNNPTGLLGHRKLIN